MLGTPATLIGSCSNLPLDQGPTGPATKGDSGSFDVVESGASLTLRPAVGAGRACEAQVWPPNWSQLLSSTLGPLDNLDTQLFHRTLYTHDFI